MKAVQAFLVDFTPFSSSACTVAVAAYGKGSGTCWHANVLVHCSSPPVMTWVQLTGRRHRNWEGLQCSHTASVKHEFCSVSGEREAIVISPPRNFDKGGWMKAMLKVTASA